MKILVVGSGGREHALVWKIGQSPRKPQIFCAPGNAGIEGLATCVPIKADDLDGLKAFALKEQIDLTVVGPEAPLALGIADEFRKSRLRIFGPTRAAARLESSKSFAKDIMAANRIPTAAARSFDQMGQALAYLEEQPVPIVVKADGLAAGKGVIVAQTLDEAELAVREMLEGGKFGASGRQILIEDCLYGEETSILVIVSGHDYVMLPTSQDHKRAGDGDTGPNTGGMGTYSPAEVVTPDLLQRIECEIVRPSVDAIAGAGIEFRGTLFIGIMLTPEGPSVIEYNARFGDPETQVVLPRIANDILALLWAATRGELADVKLETKPEHALCVVIAAKGYPDAYPKGDVITFPTSLPEGVSIFHAGTARTPTGEIVMNGGRVLGVTALAPTLRAAADKAYAVCDQIVCVSKYFRRDIGARQLNRR